MHAAAQPTRSSDYDIFIHPGFVLSFSAQDCEDLYSNLLVLAKPYRSIVATCPSDELSTMSNGKKPSHISLPAKPAPQDVFSASALDSAPTPSSTNESPSGTPYYHKQFDSIASRKSQNPNQLSPYGIGGTSGSRKPTFVETVHPRLRGASINRDRSERQSFSSLTNRRTSRIGSMHAAGGKHRVLSPGGDGDEIGSHFEAEGKPPIPVLVPGIRPAYSTPLPLLAMIVLSIVSPDGVHLRIRST